MASIKLQGDTSGELTISAPAVAGTNTLTLPASSGTLATTADTPTALSTASGSAPSYSARAWINFTGTGTIGIVASANVASITDIGTGTYTVNFTTAMLDANYSTQVTTTWAAGVTEHVTGLVYNDAPYAQAAGSVTVKTYNFSNAGASVDSNVVMVAVFR